MSATAVQPVPGDTAGVAITTAADGAAWDAYVEQHPLATVDHLWGWREIFERVFGHRTAYLTATCDGRTTGVLPVVLFRSRLFGRFAVSVPFLNYGGVLADDAGTAAALVARAREIATGFGASHLELRHQARQFEDLPFRQHKLALTRPLPVSVDALWTGTDRKVRNQVRKAQKESLQAENGGVELVDGFYSVFAENMRDLGTPVYSRELFAETLRVFPDRARVFVVKMGPRVIAGSMALRFRDTVLVPWASSLREFRPQCPNMLLYWAMLERATLDGARIFDFGRSSPGAGTHQFKLQWGASESPLHWEYVLISRPEPPNQGPTNPKFTRAIDLWKRLPLWIANSVGPHISRDLP